MPILDVVLGANYPRHTQLVNYGITTTSDENVWLESAMSYRAWSRQPRPYVATLPYTAQKVDYTPVAYTIIESAPYYSAYRETTGFAGCKLSYLLGLASSLDDEDPLAEAMNGAIDNIKGASWNFPVFAYEANKTIDSVRLLAQKATKGAEYFKRFRKQPKILLELISQLWYTSHVDNRRNRYYKRIDRRVGTDDAAKAWLRYRYELMTGVRDIEDAARTTADLLLAQPEVHKSSSRRTIAVELPDHTFNYGAWDQPFLLGIGAGANLTFHRHASAEITCKAWIATRRDNPVLSEANQLGLLNVPANIWAITPGSFFADWALDIGAYLERLPALCGLQIVDSGYSTYRRVGGTIDAWVGSDFYTTRTLEIETLEFQASTYQRSPWPNPAPVWTPKLRLNTNRLVDAAALFKTLGKVVFRK